MTIRMAWIATVMSLALIPVCGVARAQIAPAAPAIAPVAPVPQTLDLARDALARMTVPVMINGQGPFAFVIDTGADRTVISRELATKLALPLGEVAKLHSTAGEELVQTAVIDRLQVGHRTVRNINAPELAASDLGAMGMLGVDSLHDQQVVLDFAARQLQTTESRRELEDPGAVVVHGRFRFGQLILMDARIRGVATSVILDSGAQASVGNAALRKVLLGRAHAGAQPVIVQVISVTGQSTSAEFETVPEMTIGGMAVRNMPLAFAPLHTFDVFGMSREPALLLGMDILSHFRRVTIDFKRREATFTLE